MYTVNYGAETLQVKDLELKCTCSNHSWSWVCNLILGWVHYAGRHSTGSSIQSSKLLPFQPTLFRWLALGTQLGLEPMLSDWELQKIAAVCYSRSQRLMRYDVLRMEERTGLCHVWHAWDKRLGKRMQVGEKSDDTPTDCRVIFEMLSFQSCKLI